MRKMRRSISPMARRSNNAKLSSVVMSEPSSLSSSSKAFLIDKSSHKCHNSDDYSVVSSSLSELSDTSSVSSSSSSSSSSLSLRHSIGRCSKNNCEDDYEGYREDEDFTTDDGDIDESIDFEIMKQDITEALETRQNHHHHSKSNLNGSIRKLGCDINNWMQQKVKTSTNAVSMATSSLHRLTMPKNSAHTHQRLQDDNDDNCDEDDSISSSSLLFLDFQEDEYYQEEY